MSYPLSRRSVLRFVLGAPLVGAAFTPRAAFAGAAAPSRRSRVVRTTSDERGTTVVLDLGSAPFPASSAWYQDATVLVFVPRHYRVSRDKGVATVVHFHGHNTTAERAIVAHQLREQLFDSKQNAILVVPQLAYMAPDSSAGKLDLPGGFARMLDDVFATMDVPSVRAACGVSALPARPRRGRTCISAHSGGYHAAAASIRGGADVQEVYLFDALYAESDVFRDWVVAGRGKPMASRHKLVSYYTAGTTENATRALFADLERQGVDCAIERVEGTLSRAELTRAEAVSIRTSLGHGAVTSELNGLRDCLYASTLRRHLRTSWFDTKHGSRPLERRRR